MQDVAEEDVIARFRMLMAEREARLTEVANGTGVPYRSLQNYFGQKSGMPVSVYLKLCNYFGVGIHLPSKHDVTIDGDKLRQALLEAVGDLIPHYVLSNGILSVWSGPERKRTYAELAVDANMLSTLIRTAYERAGDVQQPNAALDVDQEGAQ